MRLTPSGGADRIDGRARDASGEMHVKARVRVAPEDGKANKALESLLAKALNVPKSSVSVIRGTTARLKTVAIDDYAEADLAAFINALPETK